MLSSFANSLARGFPPAAWPGERVILSPGQAFAALPAGFFELRNKFEVFARFRWAGGASPESPEVLARAVLRERVASAYPALWAVEGLGQSYALGTCRRRGQPRALLAALVGKVPRGALLPLHTGMGLGFAEHALGSPGGLAARLARFEELVLANALSGYRLASFEGLGFVTATLDSTAVPAVGAHFARRHGELAAAFWHGVGRGLYFSPLHAFPGGSLVALSRAATEPPATTAARENAVSGVAWALTLVNQRHPEVAAWVGTTARKQLGGAALGAYAHGRSAAFAAWEEATGETLAAPLEVGELASWREHRELAATGRVEELFRWQPASQVAQSRGIQG